MSMTTPEMIAYIRVILGDLSTATISDETITLFINKWSKYYNYPSDVTQEFWVVYKACIDCLRWLIAKAGTTAGSNASSRREKRGNEEIEVTFSQGSSLLQNYKDLLDYLESNPDYIDPSLATTGNELIIGGVSQTEYNRVISDSDSRYNTLGIGWPNTNSPLQPPLYDQSDV